MLMDVGEQFTPPLGGGNPKSETRNPNEIPNQKSERRIALIWLLPFGFRALGIHSDF
jgi:hypothetical protein